MQHFLLDAAAQHNYIVSHIDDRVVLNNNAVDKNVPRKIKH